MADEPKSKLSIGTIALMAGTFFALRHFGIWTGASSIDTPLGNLPVSGDLAQVIAAAVAGFLPKLLERAKAIPVVGDFVSIPEALKRIEDKVSKIPPNTPES